MVVGGARPRECFAERGVFRRTRHGALLPKQARRGGGGRPSARLPPAQLGGGEARARRRGGPAPPLQATDVRRARRGTRSTPPRSGGWHARSPSVARSVSSGRGGR